MPGGLGEKESPHNAGDLGSIPGLGRSPGEGNGNPLPGGSEGKVSAYSAGDSGSIPGSGRSPGEGNGNPLQYSCLENPMDRGVWQATVHGVAKSRTRLSDFTFTFQCSCPEDPVDRGAWWATVQGIAKSQTRLSTFKLQQQEGTVPSTLPSLLTSITSWEVGREWVSKNSLSFSNSLEGLRELLECYYTHSYGLLQGNDEHQSKE